MAITEETNAARYDGDDSTTVFTVPFYFLDDTDLGVTRRQISTGVDTPMVLNTDYTVDGAGDPAGGSITMAVAPTTDQRVIILRAVPFTQPTVYKENDNLPAKTVERSYDRGVMQVQQLAEEIDRKLGLAVGTTLTSLTFPDPEAGKVVVGNEAADGWENKTIDSSAVIYPIAINQGGTGATTAEAARANLGIAVPVPIDQGGTGQTTAALARAALGLATFQIGNFQIITANGNFDKSTLPAEVTHIIVFTLGGGGGGGGAAVTAASQSTGGAGGAGGGAAMKRVAVASLGTLTAVQIGAGGGGGVNGASGAKGGTTVFTGVCQATGGDGGAFSTAGSAFGGTNGSNGGIGTGGDLNLTGSPGDAGLRSGNVGVGGNGGSSMLSGGARGNTTGAVLAGTNATGYGAGGGGACAGQNQSGATGGVGSPGVIIVTW